MLIDITRAFGGYLHDVFLGNADWGILIGYIAQGMFAMRFVVQWIASERAGAAWCRPRSGCSRSAAA